MSSENRGIVCGKIKGHIHRLYQHKSERITTPLRNIGEKGKPIWEPITWENALSQISDRFKQIKQTRGAKSIVPFRFSGTMGRLQGSAAYDRLWTMMGTRSPVGSICSPALITAVTDVFGSHFHTKLEQLDICDLVIIWANNPAITNLSAADHIRTLRRNGAKIILIDPLKTATADICDQHFRISPGSDYALAFFLIGKMLDNINVHNKSDLPDSISQLSQDNIDRLRKLVGNYNLEQCCKVTGLSASDVKKLEDTLSQSKKFCVKLGDALARQPNGYASAWAICALVIASGQARPNGGGLMASKSLDYVPWDIGLNSLNDCKNNTEAYYIGDYAHLLLDAKAKIEATFIYNSNPAISLPDNTNVCIALSQPDLFVVVHDLYLTESSKYADIFLPATSQYEQYDLVDSYQHNDLALNQPLFDPPTDVRDNFTVANLLGNILFPDENIFFESPVERIQKMITETAKQTNLFSKDMFTLLTRSHRIRMKNLDMKFYSTTSGQPELFNKRSVELIKDFTKRLRTSEEDMPKDSLQLITVASKSRLSSSHLGKKTKSKILVFIHPSDASNKNMTNGDLVELANDDNRLSVVVSINEDVLPGTVVMEAGLPQAANSIISDKRGDFSQQTCFQGHLVTIRKMI
jgi:anaerobic selenocysteine-containing dehydrogenase